MIAQIKEVGSLFSPAHLNIVFMLSCNSIHTRVPHVLAVAMNLARLTWLLGLVSRLCVKMFNGAAQIF